MSFISPPNPKNPQDPSDGGFSLLEMALVLMIVGVMGGLSGRFFLSQKRVQRDATTVQHQERVLQALGTFLRVHKFLPCPAEPTMQPAEEWGRQDLRCSNLKYYPGEGLKVQWQGIVPFKTLGLPEQFAKDGYGHYMTYVINPNITAQPSLGYLPLEHQEQQAEERGFCYCPSYAPYKIQIYSQGSLSLTQCVGRVDENVLAVLLISHGPSGGFFNRSGERSPLQGSVSQCKKMNARGAIGGREFCLSPGADDKGTFDDILRYETRLNFAQHYGKVMCRRSVMTEVEKKVWEAEQKRQAAAAMPR